MYTNKEHNVPWVHQGRKMPGWLPFYRVWGGVGNGRYWKRRLSKARRKAWRDPHQRGLRYAESTCQHRNH